MSKFIIEKNYIKISSELIGSSIWDQEPIYLYLLMKLIFKADLEGKLETSISELAEECSCSKHKVLVILDFLSNAPDKAYIEKEQTIEKLIIKIKTCNKG